jgi:hypothetical protein
MKRMVSVNAHIEGWEKVEVTPRFIKRSSLPTREDCLEEAEKVFNRKESPVLCHIVRK